MVIDRASTSSKHMHPSIPLYAPAGVKRNRAMSCLSDQQSSRSSDKGSAGCASGHRSIGASQLWSLRNGRMACYCKRRDGPCHVEPEPEPENRRPKTENREPRTGNRKLETQQGMGPYRQPLRQRRFTVKSHLWTIIAVLGRHGQARVRVRVGVRAVTARAGSVGGQGVHACKCVSELVLLSCGVT